MKGANLRNWRRNRFLCGLLLTVAASCCVAKESVSPSQMKVTDRRIVVHPQDTGQVLENPGMGWVLHYYDNVAFNYGGRLEPSDTVDDYPGLTVIYLRIAWSHLEPQEGQFNWSVLDTPAQRWIDKGKQIALRISCCESFMRYATPQWVQQAGAKGHNFRPGKGVDPNGPYWEPDYDDPIFMEKLDKFLAALAARYDGNPEVAFIDVGSFGVWGEGHTFHSTVLPYSGETIRRHIDLHVNHFKKTLLAANDDFVDHGRGTACMDYACRQGLTLRDDSILVQAAEKAYFHADLAQMFWPTVPVVLESEHYGPSRDRGSWADGGKYLEAIEKYHASYASIHWWPREFLAENRELVAKINMRLGYRLQLVEASWPSEISANSKLWFATDWRNAGVAPCYPGGHPAVTLKDSKGGIVGVFVDQQFDVKALPVAEPGKAQVVSQKADFALPLASEPKATPLKPGIYDVYISVGTATGTPKIALPLPEHDGHRRYRLGKLTVLSAKSGFN